MKKLDSKTNDHSNKNHNVITIVNNLKDLGLLGSKRKRKQTNKIAPRSISQYQQPPMTGLAKTLIDNSPMLKQDVQRLANERSVLEDRLNSNEKTTAYIWENINNGNFYDRQVNDNNFAYEDVNQTKATLSVPVSVPVPVSAPVSGSVGSNSFLSDETAPEVIRSKGASPLQVIESESDSSENEVIIVKKKKRKPKKTTVIVESSESDDSEEEPHNHPVPVKEEKPDRFRSQNTYALRQDS